MEQQATAPRPRTAPDAVIDIDRAEAALIEHYPRLVRLCYLVLPPALGRHRRVLTAHALVQRALPRTRPGAGEPAPAGDPGYAYVRLRVLRAALDAARPRGRFALPRPGQLPPPVPQVWGLRLFPRSGGADELALDQALGRLSAPARAAFVLRAVELGADREVRALLDAAGVEDPGAAIAEATAIRVPPGSREGTLLNSVEFDPCSLQARPTDLMQRRRRTRAAAIAVAASAVCGALLLALTGGPGPDGAAAPPYTRNAAAEQALDPGLLTRAEPGGWQHADRPGFASWPARGSRADDTALLRRALAVWARPGPGVHVTATPGTPTGPAAGPPQLLYAGEVDSAVVVLLHDGLRVVRYAEARGGGGAGAAALDFARTDAADADTATAVVVGRTDGNVRYLTAPWVASAAVRDLLAPGRPARPLRRDADGVTDPVAGPAAAGDCSAWPALQLGPRLATDLGELVPARLTTGAPGSSASSPGAWAHTACRLQPLRSQGVRAVNLWHFAHQRLPGAAGTGDWYCTRAETWRGAGSRVLAQFQPPGARPAAQAAVVGRAEDSPACGPRSPHALAGGLWRSASGAWYALAAGSEDVASITAAGGVHGTEPGPTAFWPAPPGARARLSGRLRDGGAVAPLR
ncbi:hypothetical protein [Streptomyces caatingaensis]|uniref:DNA-directed RNA polymerase specialized sigma24 family protein n=1 Tax=Streptomyces caatingaensis TaxID=1678637 RepID=A0A0K9XHD6_9ACTN|nr:hypothetical protein [Streptomyces caatingaensis]KNB52814.1 hypothetical protein AC230_09230 [Streptomyces caatingaensis]